ncbi:MAG: hypothetical protein ACD_4C00358G0002 [uncultured bacterium (gcode 4)]|uniref:Uncharacterized protein n=1 Tax=uncultured bacterium (gcode 4) TaxID=1234023 RepID=K2G840_9BACT|nr:MAG: hypothetical protein ACD_4C00358G0002 [uncultured bacterium (gcode 4)]
MPLNWEKENIYTNLENLNSPWSDFKETFIVWEKLKVEDKIIQEWALKKLMRERLMVTQKTRFYWYLHEIDVWNLDTKQREVIKKQILNIYNEDNNEESAYLVWLFFWSYENDIITALNFFWKSLSFGDKERKNIKDIIKPVIEWIIKEKEFENDEEFWKIVKNFWRYLKEFSEEYLRDNLKDLKENELNALKKLINILSN